MDGSFSYRGVSLSPGVEAVKFYDEWADAYDLEMAESGYVTPGRCVAALAAADTDRSAPVLDLGCGTGLVGLALGTEGFTTIDGWDPSAEMLRHAEARDVYRVLRQIRADQPFTATIGSYKSVIAAGVLSPETTRPEIMDQIISVLPTGGHFCFSFGEFALSDGKHKARLEQIISSGCAELVSCASGPDRKLHKLDSDVYVVRRL